MRKKSKLQQRQGFFTKVYKAFKQDCKQAKESINIRELDKMFKSWT